MAEYRPNVREASMVSHLDRIKEQQRYRAMSNLREFIEPISKQIAIRLIEEHLVETTRQSALEDAIYNQLEKVLEDDEFELQYQTANVRGIVQRPNFISLFVTAFISEQLIDNDWVVDVFGTDEQLYQCVDQQVSRYCSMN